MKKIISSLVVVGSLMVSSGANALELGYVTGQYGNLTVHRAKMKNIGITLGFFVSENLFIEGQISINISEFEESETRYLGSSGILGDQNDYWGTDRNSASAQFFGVFAAYKVEKESIYGKARIGLVSVELDWDESWAIPDDGFVRYGSESGTLDDTGIAFGIGGGISVGPGAIEFEYTKLPDLSSSSVKLISLGYAYSF